MQRLRGLRQLGVIHWVYPNAGHTRFEHSIGVMHQTSRLVEGLERNSGRPGDRLVEDVTVKLLRIAGLVHDCGHSVMSHVSEPVMERQPGVEDLRAWLKELYRPRKDPSASEAIAAVLVRSKAFRALLGTPQIGADFIRDVDDAVDKIAGLLLGAPVFSNQAFLTLVINGAFDADKLDYMPRDTLMCGVPCAVDVSRLVEKVHCVSIPAGPVIGPLRQYRQWAGLGESDPFRIIALPRSAATTLEELAVARTVLYEKIYFHQKVRALEAMVRRVLENESRSTTAWLEVSDDELLTDSTVSRSLRHRTLLKRAYYFWSETPEKPDESSDTSEESIPVDAGWRQLRKAFQNGTIDALINENAKAMCRTLGVDTAVLDEVPAVLDLPKNKKLELDQFAFIGDSHADLRLPPAAWTGARAETAKHIARQQGYVYADERVLLPVHFAARKVLSETYQQPVGHEAYAKTKIDPGDLEKAHLVLKEAGLINADAAYTDVPSRRTALLNDFLSTAWPRIEALAIRFGHYQAVGRGPISESDIADYLRQFETEDNARVALRMLEKVEIKGRDFFVKSIETSMREALKAGPITHVCPLGSTGDSSAILSYYMSDLPTDLRRPVMPLELALESPVRAVLLWDDFCGNAGHSITTIAQWLGATEKVKDLVLNEALAIELNDARKKALFGSSVRIGFAMARQVGLKNLRTGLKKLGLKAPVLTPTELVHEQNGLFERSDTPFLTAAEKTNFASFCKNKTRQVFAAKTWSPEKLETRLLGHGNEAHLFAFYYNVPTVTMSLLWAGSEKWQPLFPRREKPPIEPEAKKTASRAGIRTKTSSRTTETKKATSRTSAPKKNSSIPKRTKSRR
jgi:deoxynucleoside triphosphate triphosphohydrolase SAMHD1